MLYAFSLSLNAFAKDHAEKDFAKPSPAKSPLESSPTLSQPCQIPPKKPCQKSVLFHSLFATKSLSSPCNSLSIGVFTDFSEKSFADVYALGVYYAQPNTFFRINGRINLELEAFFPAFNQTSHPANTKSTLKPQIIFGAAQDIILPLFSSRFYAGIGIGIYIRSNEGDDGRIGSAFTFGERVFVGFYHKLGEHTSMSYELIIKHYSNGNLERPNTGYNFMDMNAGVLF